MDCAPSDERKMMVETARRLIEEQPLPVCKGEQIERRLKPAVRGVSHFMRVSTYRLRRAVP